MPLRLAWVDSMKFIGMFAIYIGHFGTYAGRLYPFVFQFHVPLFFLLSGFFAESSYNKNFKQNITNKIKTILIPYAFFCAINIAFILVNTPTAKPGYIYLLLRQGLFGIRNQLFAGALWFLPCLFIVTIVYGVVVKVCQSISKKHWRLYSLITAVALFILCRLFMRPPSLPFGIDSAMDYIIYYAIGTTIFPFLKNLSFSSFGFLKRTIWSILSILCLAIVVFIYLEGPAYLTYPIIINLPLLFQWFVPVIVSLIMIFCVYIVAKAVCTIPLINKMGKETLLYCGTEQIVSKLFLSAIGVLGLSLTCENELAACIRVFLVMLLAYYLINPITNRMLKTVTSLIIQKDNRTD